jgi:AsmA protein
LKSEGLVMKKVMIALAAIVVLVIAVAIAAPLLVSGEKIKVQVAESVKAATGRDLSINGKVAIAVFPSLSVQVADVALSNPPGFRTADFIKLSQMDIRLKLLPLLSGRAEVDSFKLIDPVIALEVDDQGRGNWRFEGKSGTAESANSGTTINDIHLGDVGIENGKLSYRDVKAGSTEDFDAINVKVSLQGLDQPLDIKGSANCRHTAGSGCGHGHDPYRRECRLRSGQDDAQWRCPGRRQERRGRCRSVDAIRPRTRRLDDRKAPRSPRQRIWTSHDQG